MYRLYWAPQTAALAPQAVLEEAGLPYELVRVDLGRGEQRESSYLAVNPAGYVPALVDDSGEILYESAAIVLALCDRHGLSELAPEPADPLRGLFYRSLFYLTNSIQNIYKCYYYPQRYTTEAQDATPIKETARSKLLENWKLVERHLKARGPYHLGERFSACDIYAVMLMTWFEPPSKLFERYPALKACYDATTARPAIQRVLASNGFA